MPQDNTGVPSVDDWANHFSGGNSAPVPAAPAAPSIPSVDDWANHFSSTAANPPAPAPTPAAIQRPQEPPGYLASAGKAMMGGFASQAEPVALAASTPAIAYDKLFGKPGDTTAQDWMFRNVVDPVEAARKYWEPGPNEGDTGHAIARGVGGLASMAPLMVATGGVGAPVEGAALLGALARAGEGLARAAPVMGLPAASNTAMDVANNGGTLPQAYNAGAVSGLANTAMGALPIGMAGNLLKRGITGAGSFMGGSELARRAENAVLPENMQQQFSLPETISQGVTGFGMGAMFGHRLAPKDILAGDKASPEETPGAIKPLGLPNEPAENAGHAVFSDGSMMNVGEAKRHGVDLTGATILPPEHAQAYSDILKATQPPLPEGQLPIPKRGTNIPTETPAQTWRRMAPEDTPTFPEFKDLGPSLATHAQTAIENLDEKNPASMKVFESAQNSIHEAHNAIQAYIEPVEGGEKAGSYSNVSKIINSLTDKKTGTIDTDKLLGSLLDRSIDTSERNPNAARFRNGAKALGGMDDAQVDAAIKARAEPVQQGVTNEKTAEAQPVETQQPEAPAAGATESVKEKESAIRERSPEGVLQQEQGKAGEAGSQRIGVEQGEPGTEAPAARQATAQAATAAPEAKGTEAGGAGKVETGVVSKNRIELKDVSPENREIVKDVMGWDDQGNRVNRPKSLREAAKAYEVREDKPISHTSIATRLKKEGFDADAIKYLQDQEMDKGAVTPISAEHETALLGSKENNTGMGVVESPGASQINTGAGKGWKGLLAAKVPFNDRRWTNDMLAEAAAKKSQLMEPIAKEMAARERARLAKVEAQKGKAEAEVEHPLGADEERDIWAEAHGDETYDIGKTTDRLTKELEAKKDLDFTKPSKTVWGASKIKELMNNAVKEGTLTPEMRDFASWFIDKNPSLVTHLGVDFLDKENVKEGVRGKYKPFDRIASLVKGTKSDTTAVHEILHHLETLMPKDMQDAIRNEYRAQLANEIRAARTARDLTRLEYLTDAQKRFFTKDFIKADGFAKKMLSALSAGDIDKADYKFFDPSEFWAVNMTDRMIDRYNSTIGNKGMWAKTVQWLKEAVEHMKGWIGTSDSPMLKALDKLLKSGNGDKVQSGLLNGMNEAANNITSKSLSDRAKELHATANRLEDAGEGQSSRVAKLHSEARRINGIGRDLKEVESSREGYGDKITPEKDARLKEIKDSFLDVLKDREAAVKELLNHKDVEDTHAQSRAAMDFASPKTPLDKRAKSVDTMLKGAIDRVQKTIDKTPIKNIKGKDLGLYTKRFMLRVADGTPGLKAFSAHIKENMRVDELMNQVKLEIDKKTAPFANAVERLQMKHGRAEATRINAKMGALAQESSLRGLDPRASWEENLARKPTLSKRENEADFNEFRTRYKNFERQYPDLAKAIGGAHNILGDLYSKSMATRLANFIRGSTKGELANYVKTLDYRNAPRGADAESLIRKVFTAAKTLPADSEMRGQMAEFEKVYDTQTKDPYFHLGRSGDYFARIRLSSLDDATHKAISDILEKSGRGATDLKSMKEDGIFLRTETQDEAGALRRALTAAAGDKLEKGSDQHGLIQPNLHSTVGLNPVMRSILTSAQEHVDTMHLSVTQAAELKQAITRDFMSMLPETSSKKAMMRRKGVSGYDNEFLKNFSTRVQGMTQDLSSIYTAHQYAKNFKDIDDAINGQGGLTHTASGNTQVRAQQIANELQQRHVNSMQPTRGDWVNTLNSIGHAFYLAMSPAFILRTMFQPWHRGLPLLGGQYGANKSAGALMGASADVTKIITRMLANGWKEGGLRGVLEAGLDMSKTHLSPEEKAFMQEGMDRGKWNIGQTDTLLRMAQSKGSLHGDITRLVSISAQVAEMTNRMIVGLAAHRLSGGDTEHALEMSERVMDTFDPTANARLIGRHGFAGKFTPLMTSFMSYNLQTMQQLYLAVHDGMFNKDMSAEGKLRSKQAKKEFAGLMATTTMLSGVMGLPFMSAVAGLYNWLGKDDDRPGDVRGDIQNFLKSVLGGKAGEIASHGLSRGIGVDLSTTGMQNLLPGSDFLADRHLFKDRLQSQAISTLGPAANAGIDVAAALARISDGYYMKGLEAALPSGLKPIYKVGELLAKGYTDSLGNPMPIKATPWDVMVQASGFTPADKARYQEASMIHNINEERLSHRKQILTDMAYKALSARDPEAVKSAIQDIKDFNKANPTMPITSSSLKNAFKVHAMRIATAKLPGLGVGVSSLKEIPRARADTGFANVE